MKNFSFILLLAVCLTAFQGCGKKSSGISDADREAWIKKCMGTTSPTDTSALAVATKGLCECTFKNLSAKHNSIDEINGLSEDQVSAMQLESCSTEMGKVMGAAFEKAGEELGKALVSGMDSALKADSLKAAGQSGN